MKRVAIIGGGIAGLAAANRLQTLALEAALPLSLTLIERETYFGGKIMTERVDDFVIEGGPDTFLSYKPWGMALCKELGIVDRLHGTNSQRHGSFVMRGGKITPSARGTNRDDPNPARPHGQVIARLTARQDADGPRFRAATASG